MTQRASGIHHERGVAINAAASAGSELVLAREALRRPARGASLLNRQVAEMTGKVQLRPRQESMPLFATRTQDPRP